MALKDKQVSEAELARREFRKTKQRRSVLVAFLSTIVFALIVWFGLIAGPGLSPHFSLGRWQ